jgi:hypothetical protein
VEAASSSTRGCPKMCGSRFSISSVEHNAQLYGQSQAVLAMQCRKPGAGEGLPPLD